jgi:predicted MFS family arabinose efflux permease
LTCALLALLGAASIVFSATANTRLQLGTPAALRGRIMSIYSLMFMGTTPIGAFAIGTLSEHFGVRAALVTCAGLCLLGVLAGLLYARHHQPSLRGSARPPAPSLPFG